MYQEEYAARTIQTLWRGFDCRAMYQDEVWMRHDSAKMIQKNWRAFFQHSNYLILRYETQAAINIQRYWRGFLDFSHYTIKIFEVTRIQAHFRGYQSRKSIMYQEKCVCIIQSAARHHLSRELCKMKRLYQGEYFNKAILTYFISEFVCVKMIKQCLIILFKFAEYVILFSCCLSHSSVQMYDSFVLVYYLFLVRGCSFL